MPQASPTAGGEAPTEASTTETMREAELAGDVQKLQNEKEELHDRLLRKQAELENFRKRTQREKEDFFQHATADLVRALLPVLDAYQRAFRHVTSDVPKEYVEGMELIHKQLLDVLHRAGMEEVETSGKQFDPHLHQAVEMVEDPKYRDQEIVEELQRGYRLKNRLLRPAIVRVAVSSRP
jgi:molecular chaperone GrpE